MQKINPLIGNINFGIKKNKPKEQSFGSNYVQNYALAPIYTQVPYGIHQWNYIKLGVDKLPNGDELHLYRLSNGQKVEILKTQKGATSILTKVGVGAIDEVGFSKGISHFIEHSVFHGSKKYKTDLKDEIDRISTYDNASTSVDSTTYYMDLVSDSLEDIARAIDIQSDMLLKPTFSQIQKEKPIVCAEYERDINDETRIKLQQRFTNLFPNVDSKTFLISGDNESINSITQQEMFNYHQKFYQPHNMNTIIATKNNPDEVIKIIADSFVAKSPKTQIQVQRIMPEMLKQAKRVDLISKEDIFGSFEIAFPCRNITKSEEIKLEALGELIYSRYYKNPFLSMNVGKSGCLIFSQHNMQDIKPNEYLAFINQMIREISLRPPTYAELEEIKKDLKDDLKKQYIESNSQKIESVLENSFNDEMYLSFAAQEQLIDSLNVADIVDALKYIDFNRMSLTVIHPKGTCEKEVMEERKKFVPVAQPVVIPANFSYNNYVFSNHSEPISGEKFYSTTLNNGTKLILLDSQDEKCEVSWRLFNSDDYSSNPAIKYLLRYLHKGFSFSGNSDYCNQDAIEISGSFEVDKIQDEINNLKAFNSFEMTQKEFDEAKKEALEDIESISNNQFSLFEEMVCGKKYSQDIETLKKELEKLTINDVVNQLNNMILNSSSTVVVKAPINQNPTLASVIANSLDSTAFSFKPFDSYQNASKRETIDCDCLVKADEVKQNEISEIFQFKTLGNLKDDTVFRLLSRILSEKNFNQIREKDGLAYSTSVEYVDTYGVGAFYFNTESSCANQGDIQKIYEGYKKSVNEVKTGNITQDELVFAKNKLKGEIISYFTQGNYAVNYYLHDLVLMPNGLEILSQIEKIIDEIIIEDIRQYANYAFKANPKYIISAKSKVIEENNDFINSLGKIEKR